MQSATTRAAVPAQFSWKSICLNKVLRKTSAANRIKNGKLLRHWYKVTDGRTDGLTHILCLLCNDRPITCSQCNVCRVLTLTVRRCAGLLGFSWLPREHELSAASHWLRAVISLFPITSISRDKMSSNTHIRPALQVRCLCCYWYVVHVATLPKQLDEWTFVLDKLTVGQLFEQFWNSIIENESPVPFSQKLPMVPVLKYPEVGLKTSSVSPQFGSELFSPHLLKI
jgi:hypothetical protein